MFDGAGQSRQEGTLTVVQLEASAARRKTTGATSERIEATTKSANNDSALVIESSMRELGIGAL